MKFNTIFKGALLAMALIAIQETYAEISDIRQDLRNPLDIGGLNIGGLNISSKAQQRLENLMQSLKNENLLQQIVSGLEGFQAQYQAGDLTVADFNQTVQNLAQRLAAAGYSVDTLRSLAQSRFDQVKSNAAQILNQLRTNAFFNLITSDVNTAAAGLGVVVSAPEISTALTPELANALQSLFDYVQANATHLQGLVNQVIANLKNIQQARDVDDIKTIASDLLSNKDLNLVSTLQNLDRTDLQQFLTDLKKVDFSKVDVSTIKKAIQGAINSIGYLE